MQKKFYYLKYEHKSYSDLSINDIGILQNNHDIEKYLEILFLRINLKIKCLPSEVEYFEIENTGDRFSKKICDRCFKLLDTETNFSNNRIKKDNIITKRPSCKSCRKLKDGVSIPAKIRKKWEQSRPKGFIPFTCPICNKTTIAGISKIVLDHDHSNGHVRGWLCESCNTGIGRFDDNADIVKRAIDWLNNQKS